MIFISKFNVSFAKVGKLIAVAIYDGIPQWRPFIL
jgi:hypothetical protein